MSTAPHTSSPTCPDTSPADPIDVLAVDVPEGMTTVRPRELRRASPSTPKTTLCGCVAHSPTQSPKIFQGFAQVVGRSGRCILDVQMHSRVLSGSGTVSRRNFGGQVWYATTDRAGAVGGRGDRCLEGRDPRRVDGPAERRGLLPHVGVVVERSRPGPADPRGQLALDPQH